MQFVGMACYGVGLIVALVFGIMILIQAFKTSLLWGLAYIFIPFASLVYIVKHWEDTKKPFLYSLASLPLFIVGGVLASMGS